METRRVSEDRSPSFSGVTFAADIPPSNATNVDGRQRAEWLTPLADTFDQFINELQTKRFPADRERRRSSCPGSKADPLRL